MQVVVNSLLTTYTRQGNGKKIVVCLHGWGDSCQTFAALGATLASACTVICPDLPGFGGTQRPEGVWGIGEYAQFVADFLAKTNTAKPYAIIGHSNGGAIAIHGLAQAILQADRLVLIASAGVRNTGSQQLHRTVWQPIAKLGKAATLLLPQSTKQKLRRKLYKAAGSDLLVAEDMEETFKQVVKADVRTDAEQITIPTLIIYGRDDTAAPPSYGQMFQQIINGSQLQIIENAGHFVHHDQPDTVNKKIAEFLA